MKETRINKFLSEAGFCSRREADKLIDKNRVKINGKVPLIGTKVMPGDRVTVDNKVINVGKEKFVYLAFNKPKGIVCTTDIKREKNNIIDYLNYPKRIFPIGRLDKPSQGLIFLTSGLLNFLNGLLFGYHSDLIPLIFTTHGLTYTKSKT